MDFGYPLFYDMILPKSQIGKEQVIMKEKTTQNEIMEAIWAGESALRCLERAGEQLGNARNWGWIDMFGGNFFSGWMKHSRLEEAALSLEQAKSKLQLFQKELRDVSLPLECRMENHGFLVFADFFFDGIVTDWLVQSRIEEAREQVEAAIAKVTSVLISLRHVLDEKEAE